MVEDEINTPENDWDESSIEERIKEAKASLTELLKHIAGRRLNKLQNYKGFCECYIQTDWVLICLQDENLKVINSVGVGAQQVA